MSKQLKKLQKQEKELAKLKTLAQINQGSIAIGKEIFTIAEIESALKETKINIAIEQSKGIN